MSKDREPDHRCHNHLACSECGEEFDITAVIEEAVAKERKRIRGEIDAVVELMTKGN